MTANGRQHILNSIGNMLSMLQSAAVARQNWKFSSLRLSTRGKLLTFSIIHYHCKQTKSVLLRLVCLLQLYNVIFNSIAGDQLPTSALATQDSSSVDLCSEMALR